MNDKMKKRRVILMPLFSANIIAAIACINKKKDENNDIKKNTSDQNDYTDATIKLPAWKIEDRMKNKLALIIVFLTTFFIVIGCSTLGTIDFELH